MYDHLYARDDANRSKRYAFCGYRCEEWRAREAAYPVCLPATLRILDPANLFCNMQCTTVCITATVLRIPARYPLGFPLGVPQREARPLPKTKPQESVSRRSESRRVISRLGGAGCVACTGDESVWASGKVGKDAPAGGRARATGGGWVRVGRVGRVWWRESYWGG